MYRYRTIKSKDTMKSLNKAEIKFTLPSYLITLGISEVLIFALWAGIILLMNEKRIDFLGLIIIFQIIITIVGYKKFLSNGFKSMDDREGIVDFNEKEIKIEHEGMIEKISWEAVKEVEIYDEYMMFKLMLMELPAIMFLFNSFDKDKDEIINEIEKYAKVRKLG